MITILSVLISPTFADDVTLLCRIKFLHNDTAIITAKTRDKIYMKTVTTDSAREWIEYCKKNKIRIAIKDKR